MDARLLLFSLLLSLCALHALCANNKVLRARPDGTFNIVQFTDLHYGENPWFDIRSANVQGIILDAEQPDMVIMTGDCVSGYAWDGSQGWVAPLWDMLTQAMVDRNIPWALAMGNHDDQADLTRAQIIEVDQQYELSLTQQGPANINGSTNYFLPVYSHNVNDTVPIAILYFFDSSDVDCQGVKGWGCVYPSQVQWYISTASAIKQKYNKTIPAMAFFHIPVPEFMFMWNNETCYGLLEDTGVCCFSVNTGLFSAFKQMGDVISVHCGHDHNNDFYGYHDGIMLAQGRKTGVGGYGPPQDWLRGSRVLQIQEKPFKLSHWIRQEDGTAVKSSEQPVHAPNDKDQWGYCCDSNPSSSFSNCKAYSEGFFAEQGGQVHKH